MDIEYALRIIEIHQHYHDIAQIAWGVMALLGVATAVIAIISAPKNPTREDQITEFAGLAIGLGVTLMMAYWLLAY